MKATDFPCYLWHPISGAAILCKGPEDVREEYLDHHPSDLAKGGTAVPTTGLTRDQVIAALNAGGIAFDLNASAAELRAALQGALVNELQARKVPVPPNATVEELYKLL